MTATGASSPYHHQSFASLAALGVSLSALLAFRAYPITLGWVWQALRDTDWGNAVAALVAVGGYLLDHWSARKAQRLEVQIQKVNDQSGQLLVPITTQFHSLFWSSTVHFVDQHMDLLNESTTTTWTTTSSSTTPKYSLDFAKKLLEVYLQRPATDMPTALEHPEAQALLANLLFTLHNDDDDDPSLDQTFPSPRVSSPTELPDFLHQAIVDCRKPSSKLWKSYESFVRNELIPPIQTIANIIEESGHLMEPVPPKRLEAIYGRRGSGFGTTWQRAPRMLFYSLWLSYARAWQGVLLEWDEGVYDHMRPRVPFPIGIMFFNIEAQTIVADVQKKLVGMSQMHGHEV